MTAIAVVSAYTVSRLSDDGPDYDTWSICVEATGHGRWAVRWHGRCLTKLGDWVWEPMPSGRDEDFLARTRWNDHDEAIAAAIAAEPHLVVNDLRPADVAASLAPNACFECGGSEPAGEGVVHHWTCSLRPGPVG